MLLFTAVTLSSLRYQSWNICALLSLGHQSCNNLSFISFFVDLKWEQLVDGTQFDRVMLPSSYWFLMSCFIQPDTIMTKFSPRYCSSSELPIITSTFSHFPFFPLSALLFPRKFYLVTLWFFCVALASHEYIMTQSSLCLLPKLKIQQ